MKLLVINPNTSVAMTASIAAAARAAASAGTEVRTVHPTFGPETIESHFEEAVAAAGVAEQARAAHDWQPDAVVIACFGDPGLDAAREVFDVPVLGIAEAAFHAAAFLSTGFSVVTTLTRTCGMAERLLHRYGFDRVCRGVHGTDVPVLDLEHPDPAVLALIESCARAALASDRSGAIVLGCAGMAPLCAQLQRQLGVPVVDGVAAAVKFAEALVGLGLRTAKTGDYAAPPVKAWTGVLKHLGD